MNVVFDFGGVVFRWTPHEFLTRLLPERAPDEAAARVLTHDFFQGFKGDWADFDRGALAVPELASRIECRTGIALADAQRVIEAVPHELTPMAPTLALMQRLRERGHGLWFLSNMPPSYADHLEATHPLSAWFEAGVFSCRVGLIKPEAAIYRLAEQRYGAAPNELLLIDDVAANVASARECGWGGVHFVDAQQCERDLVAAGLM